MVRDALNRVNQALGGKAGSALGLSNGHLWLNNDPSASRLETDASTNTISGPFKNDPARGDFSANVDRVVHEFGHLADWHAHPQDAKWGWSAVSNQWGASSGWRQHHELEFWYLTSQGRAGAPTSYAQSGVGEDFADTFTWYVDYQNGVSFSRFEHPVAESWAARQDALQVALDQLP